MGKTIEHKNNSEFIGDESKFKYLAIHGYEKFQRDKNGSLGDGSRLWIKDACRKDSDADYSGLTFFHRYVLDGLRRLTGLHGQWPHNDPMWISRALCAGRTDRPHVPYALQTLTTRGLLILSNQRLGSREVVEVVDKNSLDGSKSRTDDAPQVEAGPEPTPKTFPAFTPQAISVADFHRFDSNTDLIIPDACDNCGQLYPCDCPCPVCGKPDCDGCPEPDEPETFRVEDVQVSETDGLEA